MNKEVPIYNQNKKGIFDAAQQAITDLQTNDQQVQDSIDEALAQSDLDPNYVSYDVGVEPPAADTDGTIGAYYSDRGKFQKVEWDDTSADWKPIGTALQGQLDIYNIRWFALPTARNYVTEINDALAALSEGDVLYFPSGEYELNDTIDITIPNLTIILAQDAVVYLADNQLDAGGTAEEKIILFNIEADGVKLIGGTFDGNIDNQGSDGANQDENRSDCIRVANCKDCTFRDITVINAARHGIVVTGESGDVENITIENIIGYQNARDTVSVEGNPVDAQNAGIVQHVTVENVKGIESRMRGTLEFVDGVRFCSAMNIYGFNQAYCVANEDHGAGSSPNEACSYRDIVAGAGCDHAVLMLTQLEHKQITIDGANRPVQVRGVDGFTLTNINIRTNDLMQNLEYEQFGYVHIEDSKRGNISNITLQGTGDYTGAGIFSRNCDNLNISNITILEQAAGFVGINLQVNDGESHGKYTVNSVRANVGSSNDGIKIAISGSDPGTGSIDHVLITGNMCTVNDTVGVTNKVIDNNLEYNG